MRILFILTILFLFSCKKDDTKPNQPVPSHPSMNVIEYNNKEAGFGDPLFVDLENDGVRDLGFSAILVGDPLLQADKLQFFVTGNLDTWFPINNSEQTPVLAAGADIGFHLFAAYTWCNAPATMLAQRVEPVSGAVYWEGDWRFVSHTYFPFYVQRNAQRYFGWIELSFDMGSRKIIIHRIAVSREAEKNIIAGKI
jgi:hypothetical protein